MSFLHNIPVKCGVYDGWIEIDRKGKPKGVYTEKRLAGIAPYHWKPGAPSPNPGGRPRQHKEMVAELRSHAP